MENQSDLKINDLLTESQKQEIRDQLIREKGGVPMSESVKKFCENKKQGTGHFGLGGKKL